MLNQVVLVGRISQLKPNKVIVAVPRSYKNAEGEYDTDYIPIKLTGGIAETTLDYCKKGDMIGVKGRLMMEHGDLVIMAEKVSFLSSGKN